MASGCIAANPSCARLSGCRAARVVRWRWSRSLRTRALVVDRDTVAVRDALIAVGVAVRAADREEYGVAGACAHAVVVDRHTGAGREAGIGVGVAICTAHRDECGRARAWAARIRLAHGARRTRAAIERVTAAVVDRAAVRARDIARDWRADLDTRAALAGRATAAWKRRVAGCALGQAPASMARRITGGNE